MFSFRTRWYEYLIYGPWIAVLWLWDQKFALLLGAFVGAIFMYAVK